MEPELSEKAPGEVSKVVVDDRPCPQMHALTGAAMQCQTIISQLTAKAAKYEPSFGLESSGLDWKYVLRKVY